jgi:ketosteroid isomerase-like protein
LVQITTHPSLAMKPSPLLFLATLLTACAPSMHASRDVGAASPAAAFSGTRADARDALLAADRAHAAASAAGLAAGFPTALADDALFLYPRHPIVRGRAAAAALLASLPNAAGRTMTWRSVRADLSADGTRGYTVGYGELTGITENSGSPWIKYIAFWKRDDAGRGPWRVAAWVMSGGAPGAPAAAPAGCPSPLGAAADAAASLPPASSASAAASVADREAAARDAVIRADASFAALAESAGPGVAFRTWVADDGVSLGGGPELTCGRAAVGAAFANVPAGQLRWGPVAGDAASSGDLGFTVGVATIGGAPTSHYSKYLTVWKRQPGGEWRFVADGGNAAPTGDMK